MSISRKNDKAICFRSKMQNILEVIRFALCKRHQRMWSDSSSHLSSTDMASQFCSPTHQPGNVQTAYLHAQYCIWASVLFVCIAVTTKAICASLSYMKNRLISDFTMVPIMIHPFMNGVLIISFTNSMSFHDVITTTSHTRQCTLNPRKLCNSFFWLTTEKQQSFTSFCQFATEFFSCKGQVMRKAFTCHDVIICQVMLLQ